MPTITVDIVSQMFPGTGRAAIEANLPSILYAIEAAQLTTLPLMVYTLATIAAESASFEPVTEMPGPGNTSKGGRPFDLYDARADLGNHHPGDGARYCGRGYVQLTGQANYRLYGPLVGQPELEQNPELANDPDTAASLLAAYVKHHVVDITARLAQAGADPCAARKPVNGGENGKDRFTHAYQTGMALLSAGAANST